MPCVSMGGRKLESFALTDGVAINNPSLVVDRYFMATQSGGGKRKAILQFDCRHRHKCASCPDVRGTYEGRVWYLESAWFHHDSQRHSHS